MKMKIPPGLMPVASAEPREKPAVTPGPACLGCGARVWVRILGVHWRCDGCGRRAAYLAGLGAA